MHLCVWPRAWCGVRFKLSNFCMRFAVGARIVKRVETSLTDTQQICVYSYVVRLVFFCSFRVLFSIVLGYQMCEIGIDFTCTLRVLAYEKTAQYLAQ